MLPKRFYSWDNYPMDEVEKEKPLKSDPQLDQATIIDWFS